MSNIYLHDLFLRHELFMITDFQDGGSERSCPSGWRAEAQQESGSELASGPFLHTHSPVVSIWNLPFVLRSQNDDSPVL